MSRLPERVRYADGHEEPFAPERITRRLYLAAETLGMADAFLARELTEGVLHFLALDEEGPAITPEAIAETVVKVVRELGHPALAGAFEQRRPPVLHAPPVAATPWPTWVNTHEEPQRLQQAAAEASFTQFSLDHVYSRELTAAHAEGLLHLSDLATPLELAGLVLPPSLEVGASIEQARSLAGQWLVMDAPEYLVAERGESVERFAVELEQARRGTGLVVELHLNTAEPPPHYALERGPLFGNAEFPRTDWRSLRRAFLGHAFSPMVRVVWHLHTPDDLLHADLLQILDAGRTLEFVIDRPKRPTLFGNGLSRRDPAVLTTVGMNLVHLGIERATVLKKVGSLARFAKTVGHVRQDFLRKHGRPGLREGFLLERAKLLVQPLGMAATIETWAEAPSTNTVGLVQAIQQALATDRPRTIPFGIDHYTHLSVLMQREGGTLKQQLRGAGLVEGTGELNVTRPELPELFRTLINSDAQRLRVSVSPV